MFFFLSFAMIWLGVFRKKQEITVYGVAIFFFIFLWVGGILFIRIHTLWLWKTQMQDFADALADEKPKF